MQDWNDWSADWQRSEMPTESAALRRQVQSEVSRMRRSALLQTLVIGAVVVGIALDLTHAASAGDLVRAGLVLLLVGVVAVTARNRRRADALDVALPTQDFIQMRKRRVRAELNGVYVAWIAIALELAFLIPWWIDGWAIHRGGYVSTPALWAGWLQAAATVFILAWTARLYLHARSESRRIEAASTDA